jgi:ribosome biogenesis protein ERB1
MPNHRASQIVKLVNAIRNGWIRPPQEKKKDEEIYMMWDGTDDDIKRPRLESIPPPKPMPPGHAESYNPPPEYLPTEEEIKAWELMDPEDR